MEFVLVLEYYSYAGLMILVLLLKYHYIEYHLMFLILDLYSSVVRIVLEVEWYSLSC